jgi:hypothetical protein
MTEKKLSRTHLGHHMYLAETAPDVWKWHYDLDDGTVVGPFEDPHAAEAEIAVHFAKAHHERVGLHADAIASAQADWDAKDVAPVVDTAPEPEA